MNGGGDFGNVNGTTHSVGWAYTQDEGLGGVVGVHLVETDFDYVVGAYIDAGGFKVEEDQGTGKVEEHEGN